MNTTDQEIIDIFKTSIIDIGTTFKNVKLILDKEFIVLDDHINVLRKHYVECLSGNKLIYHTSKVLNDILITKTKRDYFHLIFTNLNDVMRRNGDDNLIEYFSTIDIHTLNELIIDGESYCDLYLICGDVINIVTNELSIDSNIFNMST